MKYIKLFENFDLEEQEEKASGYFWGTIGAGILPIAKSTGRILVSHRSPHVMEPNTWGVWGGKLDDMETNDPREAAKQEFLEESGFDDNIELIPAYVFKHEERGLVTFTYHNYIGLIDDEFEPELDWETQGYEWLSYREFRQLKPKHYGLIELIKHSDSIIRQYSK